MRVVLTRPEREASSWLVALTQAGMDAVALPLIVVAGAPDVAAVQNAWLRLDQFDALMFVSGNAVDYFFQQKPSVAPDWPAQAAIKTRAFVTGPGSRAALLRQGVGASRIDAPSAEAGQFDSEALWTLVSARVVPGYQVLIVRGAGPVHGSGDGAGRDWFARQVQSRGGLVEFVVAYQRSSPAWTPAELELAHLAANDDSVWLFSSSEAIANLRTLMPDQSWRQARAVATHPRIAQAAHEAGFGVVCESRPLLGDVVASIESLQ
jgi:uroporphyrinogen-III synthase